MTPTQTATTAQVIELAMRHHKSGNLALAESIYREALMRDPANSDVLYFLGAVAYQTGKYDAAEEYLRHAIRVHAAAPAYHNGLGLVLQRLGRLDEAAESFEAALKLNPQFAEARSNLGSVFWLQGRLADAAAAYQQTLSSQPQFADAHCGLGKVYVSQNMDKEARVCFERALALNPMLADAHNSLGLMFGREGKRTEAEQRFRRALELNPDFAEAHNNLGHVLVRLDNMTEAVDCYRRAIMLNPRLPEVHVNLGNVLGKQGKFDEAFVEYEAALRQAPDSVLALQAMGNELERQGRLEEALSCFHRALSLNPSDGSLQVRFATLLPAIPESNEDMMRWRRRFEAEVSRLVRDGLVLKGPVEEINPINFFLSYHGLGNREIQTLVARMYEKACPSLLWTAPHCRGARAPSERLRIGFISKFMYVHSIGRTTRGLLANLSRDRFETYALFVPPLKDDKISQFIRANADHSLVLPEELEGARQVIADLKLDVLFYQDIGMEAFTYYLAFARLAPVQCVSFGHPDTTGITNMDYFVSSDLFEPPDAAAAYSEKLFLLRNLGTLAYYYRPALPKLLKGRGDFGLPREANIYICPQTLFKFHPDFDAMLGGILRADPSGLLVLIEGRPKVKPRARLIMARFGRAFPDLVDRVVFLPKQSGVDFVNLIAVCDVMLDTIHFNGMNTSLEAFSVGTPVVTLPRDFQRGRHTFGMYTRMGITDCVARTADEYVQIALRLGTDKAYRDEISAKILANNGVLYEDLNVVREFERFFTESVARIGDR
jgi:predicted O-linked N-acetylglucosamine transferase (SPINDLY family)